MINKVPHGTSFQSVIQFAPAARQEPLMGANAMTAGASFNVAATGNGTAILPQAVRSMATSSDCPWPVVPTRRTSKGKRAEGAGEMAPPDLGVFRKR